ncbi:hypothetical protein NC652_003792 [Populus alba x Populus x berolinensis]|nr:hypothetical protein NC652_003792 [Populus alba x Populus x berolinensis]
MKGQSSCNTSRVSIKKRWWWVLKMEEIYEFNGSQTVKGSRPLFQWLGWVAPSKQLWLQGLEHEIVKKYFGWQSYSIEGVIRNLIKQFYQGMKDAIPTDLVAMGNAQVAGIIVKCPEQ